MSADTVESLRRARADAELARLESYLCDTDGRDSDEFPSPVDNAIAIMRDLVKAMAEHARRSRHMANAIADVAMTDPYLQGHHDGKAEAFSEAAEAAAVEAWEMSGSSEVAKAVAHAVKVLLRVHMANAPQGGKWGDDG